MRFNNLRSTLKNHAIRTLTKQKDLNEFYNDNDARMMY